MRRRPTTWPARTIAPAVAAAMVLTIAPASSASTVAEETTAPTSFAGFTEKSELRAEGRQVVESGVLPVADGSAPAGTGTTYFVDSTGGDDSAAGTSETTAWQTFANVNATEFQPGDRILLKAGSTWTAEGDEVAREAYDYTTWSDGEPTDVDGADPTALLAPQGSGTADDPIVLSSYGEGPAPELNGRGVVNDTLQLTNQEHWDISNLEITNMTDGFDPTTFEPLENVGQVPGEENPATGDLRGIHVQAENAGTLSGYEIHHVFVHDVSGVGWSVSASGLDRSKRTGGIMFEGLKGDAQTVSQFEDVVVRDSYVANTSFANVTFKQFAGMGTNRYQNRPPGWGDRAAGKAAVDGTITEDPDWRPHSNIEISGNYLTNRGTQYGWDSMYLTSVQGADVEDNLVDGAGVSGIEMYYSDDIVVQNNEVAEIEVRRGAADSNGIDPDRGTSNILMQGNYVHESGEGILLCGFGFSTAVVRHNVIQDVDKNYINPHGSSGVNVVYNNLMYNTQEPERGNTVGFFKSSGSPTSYLQDDNLHYLFNNVFVNTREDVAGAAFQADYPGVSFSNNSYHGPQVTPPDEEEYAITADPKIGGEPAEDITNAMIASGDSPLIAAGTPVDLSEIVPGFDTTGSLGESQLPLAVDFFGTELTTPPSVGPTAYVPAEGHGLVTGTVRDEEGEYVPGATVAYASSTVTADAVGRFAIEAPADEYTLVPSAEGYADGEPVTVTLRDRETLSTDLALGATTATEGTVVGTVTSTSSGVAEATVTASRGDETTATATTGADGTYLLADLPAGDGYTISVAKDGYEDASQSGVTVRAARTVTVDLALSLDLGETEYAINETFDDESTGTFTETSDGVLVARPNDSAGTIMVEEGEGDEEGNKYLSIDKSGSGTLAVHNAVEQNLTGTVTIEARLQRTTTSGTPNQTAMYSYTGSDWKAGDPAGSSNPSATFGFSGGDIMTHNVTGSSSTVGAADYTVGQWHTVRNVVDLGTGTFDFYVDDMTAPVLTDQPLRSTVEELDHFLFFSSSSNKGDLLVDYFRVNTGAPQDYDDSSLGSVTAETTEGVVELTESADGLTYSGTVHPFTETVTVGATAGSTFARVAVDGTEVTDGGGVEIELAEGSNDDAEIVTEVPVVVTAEDGSETTYVVAISRTHPNQLAELRRLSVDGLELSPVFSSDRHGEANPYEVSEVLDADVASVQLAWELGWADQPVQLDGETLPAGTTEATVELQDGLNVVEVTVGSFTGDFATYVIELTRESGAPEHPAWDASTVYDDGDRVTHDGAVFEATWWTRNEEPGASPWGSWQEIAETSDGTAVWTSSRIFVAGDVVEHDGATYTARWWTRNQEPGASPWGPWELID